MRLNLLKWKKVAGTATALVMAAVMVSCPCAQASTAADTPTACHGDKTSAPKHKDCPMDGCLGQKLKAVLTPDRAPDSPQLRETGNSVFSHEGLVRQSVGFKNLSPSKFPNHSRLSLFPPGSPLYLQNCVLRV